MKIPKEKQPQRCERCGLEVIRKQTVDGRTVELHPESIFNEDGWVSRADGLVWWRQHATVSYEDHLCPPFPELLTMNDATRN